MVQVKLLSRRTSSNTSQVCMPLARFAGIVIHAHVCRCEAMPHIARRCVCACTQRCPCRIFMYECDLAARESRHFCQARRASSLAHLPWPIVNKTPHSNKGSFCSICRRARSVYWKLGLSKTYSKLIFTALSQTGTMMAEPGTPCLSPAAKLYRNKR